MRTILVILMFCCALCLFTGCDDHEQSPIVAIGIDEETIPDSFYLGDVDLTEIDVILFHEDGTTSMISLNESMLQDEDLIFLESVGTHTYVVSHQDYETTITIVIIPVDVTERTINFITGEGTPVDPLIAVPGIPIDPPSNPEREGHAFLGWFLEESLETRYIFDVMPEEDLTLYAKWAINTYTVTFKDHDDTELKVETVEYGTSAVPPVDPHREGHTFTGWDVPYDSVTEDLIVTALYVINQYTVTFYDEDEVTILGTSTVDYGTPATPPDDPTKAATPQYTYTFNGWDRDYSEVHEDMSVHATYQATLNQFTITFKDIDGTVLQEETLDYGALITAPDEPVREGHTFDGWSLSFDIVTEDLVIHATYTTDQHQVIYYEEDGETIIQSTIYEYGADLSTHDVPSAPLKEGHTFDGFEALPDTMPAHDVIRVATYTVNSYTLTFEPNGGSEVEPMTEFYDTTIEAPTPPIREGYDFIGWFIDLELENEFTFDHMPSQSLTLHAKWEEAEADLINHFFLRVKEQTDDQLVIEVVLGGIADVNAYDARVYFDASVLTYASHINNVGNIVNPNNPGEIIFVFSEVFTPIQMETVLLTITFDITGNESTDITVEIIQASKIDVTYTPVEVETNVTGIHIAIE